MADIGRPTLYTPDLAATICSLIADGMSMRKVCERDDMPGRVTVWRWIGEHSEFRSQYEAARDAQMQTMADEMCDIADDKGEEAQSRRVRIDTRKWLLSKLKPGTYGDKVDLNHSGGFSVSLTGSDAKL